MKKHILGNGFYIHKQKNLYFVFNIYCLVIIKNNLKIYIKVLLSKKKGYDKVSEHEKSLTHAQSVKSWILRMINCG